MKAKDVFRVAQNTAYDEFIKKSQDELNEAGDYDARLFWRVINRYNDRKTTGCTCLTINDEDIRSPLEIADAFEDYYANLYSTSDNDKNDQNKKDRSSITIIPNLQNDSLNAKFTFIEVDKALRQLNVCKSPGTDKIYNTYDTVEDGLYNVLLYQHFYIQFLLTAY